MGNVFTANTATVNGSGYAVNVTKNADRNTVGCDNTAAGAAEGLSPHPCTPHP